MTAHRPTATSPAPTSALQAGLARLRASGLSHLLGLVAICLLIAVVVYTLNPRRFDIKFTYSLAIGLSCSLLMDGSRLAAAALDDAMRRRRGLPYLPAGERSGWLGVWPGVVLAVVLGPIIGMEIGDRIFGFRSPSLLNFANPNTRFTLVISLIACLAGVVYFSTRERLLEARAQAQAAERLASENQLRLLQSQLEPHMLFNTLANLRVLIGLDPARAQAMLDHLIAFLRSTLTASRAERHALGEECRHLADYLALMTVRMGPRLRTAIDLPTELAGLPVPPLLLQPLVENAIKHGLEPQVDGGELRISARRHGEQLVLTVRDTGVGLAPQPAADGTHFGTCQVRERLVALFGQDASLVLRAADDDHGGTEAVITLPFPAPHPSTP